MGPHCTPDSLSDEAKSGAEFVLSLFALQQDAAAQLLLLLRDDPGDRGLDRGGGVGAAAAAAVRERVPGVPRRHGERQGQQSRHLQRILKRQFNLFCQ